jgi:hypothetical protein
MNLDPIGVVKEVGAATQTFFSTLREQPLSLALVVMNFVLLGYLFYYTSTILTQREVTTALIVGWQKETDKLMANCVSKEVLESVVGALERQLQEMRKQLDGESPNEPRDPMDLQPGGKK